MPSVVKLSDTAYTNQELIDDPDLALSGLSANTRFTITGRLILTMLPGASGFSLNLKIPQNAGAKSRFTFPGEIACTDLDRGGILDDVVIISALNVPPLNRPNTPPLLPAMRFSRPGSGERCTLMVRFSAFVRTGPTPGSVTLQFATTNPDPGHIVENDSLLTATVE
jgi:hypothetical protein